jgi:hypothetical protein
VEEAGERGWRSKGKLKGELVRSTFTIAGSLVEICVYDTGPKQGTCESVESTPSILPMNVAAGGALRVWRVESLDEVIQRPALSLDILFQSDILYQSTNDAWV